MELKLPEQLNFLSNRKKKQKKTTCLLKKKKCVISGATSGVGLSALDFLSYAGADILMLARNLEKASSVKEHILSKHPDTDIDIVYADFSDLDTVREAAKKILEIFPQIHILINSAGLFCTSRNKTREGFEMTFCVNHLAPFLLTILLLERLKGSAPARIIQVNSQGHRFGGLDIDDLAWENRFYNGYKAYGASKTAQLLTVWELADSIRNTKITVNAMHPGGVKTNIGLNNGPLYRWYSRNIIWHFLDDPKKSGEAIYYLAAAQEMENISGRYFNLTIDEKPAVHALDRKLSKKVWEISKRFTGLKQ